MGSKTTAYVDDIAAHYLIFGPGPMSNCVMLACKILIRLDIMSSCPHSITTDTLQKILRHVEQYLNKDKFNDWV